LPLSLPLRFVKNCFADKPFWFIFFYCLPISIISLSMALTQMCSYHLIY